MVASKILQTLVTESYTHITDDRSSMAGKKCIGRPSLGGDWVQQKTYSGCLIGPIVLFPDSKTCYLHERNPGVVPIANRMQFEHPWGPQYGSTYHPGQLGILQESGNHTTAHSAGVNQQSKFGRSKNCLAPIGSGATQHCFGARQVTIVCVYIHIQIGYTYIYIYISKLISIRHSRTWSVRATFLLRHAE